MARIAIVLTPGFADWETSLLAAVAHGFYGAEVFYATPRGKAVTSMGGMTVAPSLALEAIDVTTFDALVLCGGAGWRSAEAPQIGALVQAAHQAGRVVAGICDGTFALAKTGLLDGVAHTSNGAGYLDETGYAGAAHYRDSARAIRDRGVVTAGGTAPVAFMLEVMAAIGLGDERLAHYAGLHAAQFRAAA